MYYSHYENYFSKFCPNSNTLIRKLDTVYSTLCLMGNQFMEFFTHILHKTKWYIK